MLHSSSDKLINQYQSINLLTRHHPSSHSDGTMDKSRTQVHAFKGVALTERQLEVLRVIQSDSKIQIVSPTYDEIAVKTRRSKWDVRGIVDLLIKKGILRVGPGRNRNLEITDIGRKALKVRRPK